MLAGELVFYSRENNEAILRIDMETIDVDTYLNSEEFHALITTKQIERVISSVYYTNGAPVETIVFSQSN